MAVLLHHTVGWRMLKTLLRIKRTPVKPREGGSGKKKMMSGPQMAVLLRRWLRAGRTRRMTGKWGVRGIKWEWRLEVAQRGRVCERQRLKGLEHMRRRGVWLQRAVFIQMRMQGRMGGWYFVCSCHGLGALYQFKLIAQVMSRLRCEWLTTKPIQTGCPLPGGMTSGFPKSKLTENKTQQQKHQMFYYSFKTFLPHATFYTKIILKMSYSHFSCWETVALLFTLKWVHKSLEIRRLQQRKKCSIKGGL